MCPILFSTTMLLIYDLIIKEFEIGMLNYFYVNWCSIIYVCHLQGVFLSHFLLYMDFYEFMSIVYGPFTSLHRLSTLTTLIMLTIFIAKNLTLS